VLSNSWIGMSNKTTQGKFPPLHEAGNTDTTAATQVVNADSRHAKGVIPSEACPGARSGARHCNTADALRQFIDLDPKRECAEDRQAESIWAKRDRDQSKLVAASPTPKPETGPKPIKQIAKISRPSKARAEVRPNNPAKTAVLEKGELQPLLLNSSEVCRLLGSISKRTLARMEKAGTIRSICLLRHKLYARKDIEILVENLCKWEA